MRFASHIPPDQWSRVRKIGYVFSNGAPDDNMSMLPALKMEMRALGHTLEYTTFGGNGMKAVILSVRKAVYDRLHKKASRIPAAHRNEAHTADLLP